jgi:hypothetical protein
VQSLPISYPTLAPLYDDDDDDDLSRRAFSRSKNLIEEVDLDLWSLCVDTSNYLVVVSGSFVDMRHLNKQSSSFLLGTHTHYSSTPMEGNNYIYGSNRNRCRFLKRDYVRSGISWRARALNPTLFLPGTQQQAEARINVEREASTYSWWIFFDSHE